YLTAGMLVARDPETGVETEGYHRFQLKGPDRMGVSLHSRRRMFEYQRRAEARGEALPCAVALGLHALVSMGSLAYPALRHDRPPRAAPRRDGDRGRDPPWRARAGGAVRRVHRLLLAPLDRARLPGEGDLDAGCAGGPVPRLRARAWAA